MLSILFSHYPTFLIFLAVFVSVVFTMLFMPPWIKFLKSSHIGQEVRADGPKTHLVKQGTPTMGGVMMLLAVTLSILLVGYPSPETYALLVATLLAGVLGLVDDSSKVAHKRSLGLTPHAKLIGQFAIASVAFVLRGGQLARHRRRSWRSALRAELDLGVLTTTVLHDSGAGRSAFPWLYVVIVSILLVAGMCNAVNLTDGLDGLCGGHGARSSRS
jgi:phospho-N-acetylmuramoyl-pentapeptide-transferase